MLVCNVYPLVEVLQLLSLLSLLPHLLKSFVLKDSSSKYLTPPATLLAIRKMDSFILYSIYPSDSATMVFMPVYVTLTGMTMMQLFCAVTLDTLDTVSCYLHTTSIIDMQSSGL